MKQKLILVITNDSTVFLKSGIASAFEMFGGRVTEVKNLVARLDMAKKDDRKMCDVSFGIISTFFGFVPGNYTIAPYTKVMSNKEEYEAVQAKKDFLGNMNYTSKPFDKIILCVPKDMFEMILKDNTFDNGKVIAVTNPIFKEECEKRDWIYLERKGARVGNENADMIFSLIESMC